MNIKQQYSIRQFGLPSVYSGTNILTQKDGHWYINGQDTNIELSTIPPQNNNEFFIKEDTQTDNYVFQKNLELLNQRVNAIHKELTYWDLYKLTAAVSNPEDLDAVFSSLSVGQSLVINCPTFQRGNVVYSRGDIIVRTAEDQEIKIDSVATGVFVPTSLTKKEEEESNVDNNVYCLTYTFTPGEPTEKEITHELQDNPTATIYGELFDIEDDTLFSFKVLYQDLNNEILPIIKLYSMNYEEISTDEIVVTKNDLNWNITVAADAKIRSVLKYIQVK